MKPYLSKQRRPTILITGSLGQLGQALCNHRCAVDDFHVMAFSRQELDITQAASIQSVLAKVAPDIILNTAAYTAVDAAEKEIAPSLASNHSGAHHLALACQQYQIPLVHISTDYIFDGTKTSAYQEEDRANPINQYGKSKWLGEQAVREHCDQHLIVRTSGLFSEYGPNFLKTVLGLIKEKRALRIVNDQVTCPTYAGNLARALYALVRQILLTKTQQHWGAYHYCDAGPVSWYQFARMIVHAAKARHGFCTPEVHAITTAEYAAPAARPAFSVLDCQKIATVYGITQANWQDSLPGIVKLLK